MAASAAGQEGCSEGGRVMAWDEESCSYNIYSSPEKFGMQVVCELEDPDASYTFDTVVVWRQADTGLLFFARDSGCSCPVPFEDATPIPLTTKAFDAEMQGWLNSRYGSVAGVVAAYNAFMVKVNAARAE